jgi:hypothetical protein
MIIIGVRRWEDVATVPAFPVSEKIEGADVDMVLLKYCKESIFGVDTVQIVLLD